MSTLFISTFLLLRISSLVSGHVCITDGLFANPDDEHSFFQCSFGTSFLMPCPAGLVWNQDKYICDWNTPQPLASCDGSQSKNCRETSTWSSDGVALVGQDMKPGSDARHLISPFGLFIDSEHGNNLYVADTDNYRIQKFEHGSLPSGGITVAGGNRKGNASNQLSMPRAVYVDKDENIYIADDDNHRIQLFRKGAAHGITVAGGNGKGKALNQIGACHGVFVHEKTNALYVSDFYNDRVVRWNTTTNEGIVVAGGTGGKNASQLSMPRGIFVDECETVYVADLYNSRVQKWIKGATEGVTVAGGNGKGSNANQLSDPWDVKVDQFKNIYVADTGNARIVKWGPNQLTGTIVAGGNGYGTKPNQFKEAHSLALDKQGNIFVSERLNHRIQMFTIDDKTKMC